MDARISEPTTPGEGSSLEAVAQTSVSSGLKAITRLTGEDRLSRIIPTADYSTVIKYYSHFAREFIRAHYNFCCAKLTVARGGKRAVIDATFRESEEWFRKAIAWANKKEARPFPMRAEEYPVDITIPVAGRLITLLGDYELFYKQISYATFADSISSETRDASLNNAGRKVMIIRDLCIPDNDQYDIDGTLRKDATGDR